MPVYIFAILCTDGVQYGKHNNIHQQTVWYQSPICDSARLRTAKRWLMGPIINSQVIHSRLVSLTGYFHWVIHHLLILLSRVIHHLLIILSRVIHQLLIIDAFTGTYWREILTAYSYVIHSRMIYALLESCSVSINGGNIRFNSERYFERRSVEFSALPSQVDKC